MNRDDGRRPAFHICCRLMLARAPRSFRPPRNRMSSVLPIGHRAVGIADHDGAKAAPPRHNARASPKAATFLECVTGTPAPVHLPVRALIRTTCRHRTSTPGMQERHEAGNTPPRRGRLNTMARCLKTPSLGPHRA